METVALLYLFIGIGAGFRHFTKCYNCWNSFTLLSRLVFEFVMHVFMWPYKLIDDLIVTFRKPMKPPMAAFYALPGETVEEFEKRISIEMEKIQK